MNRPLLLISLCQFQFAFKKEYIRKIRKDMLLNIAWPCKFTCTIHIWHQTEQTICQLIKMYSFFFKRPMIAIFIPRNENASMWALILTVKENYSFIQLLTSSSEKLYCIWFQVLRKFTWHVWSISNNQSSDPNSIEWKHKLQGNEWDLQMKGSVQNIRGYYSFQLINNIRRKNDLKKQGSDGTESLRTSLYLPCFVLHKAKNHNWKKKMKNWFFITSVFNIAKEQNTNSYYLMMSWLILVS